MAQWVKASCDQLQKYPCLLNIEDKTCTVFGIPQYAMPYIREMNLGGGSFVTFPKLPAQPQFYDWITFTFGDIEDRLIRCFPEIIGYLLYTVPQHGEVE